MKTFYCAIIATLLCCVRSFGQCDNIISLTSQADVNSYRSTYGCTDITGMLFIMGSDITNLDSLYSIKTIRYLRIYSNPNLVSLRGLEGLTNVTDLEIDNNRLLADFTGLNNLEVIGGNALFGTHPAASSLRGLDKLRYVSGDLNIGPSTAFTSLDGLEHLEYAGTISLNGNEVLANVDALSSIKFTFNLILRGNRALNNLNGFRNITRVSSLHVIANSSLTSFNGLEALDSVQADILIMDNRALTSIAALDGPKWLNNISIRNNNALATLGVGNIESMNQLLVERNQALTNLDGLSGLKKAKVIELLANFNLANIDGLSSATVRDKIFIYENGSLQNVDGLAGLRGSVGELSITQNRNLQNIDALQGITEVREGGLYITSNDALANIHGLSSITESKGDVFITGSGISDLEGLSSLTKVGGILQITANPNLANVSALSGITQVGKAVLIANNNVLTSLDGLSSLTSIGGSLGINNNILLENISGLQSLTSIGGRFQVMGNPKLASLEGLNAVASIGWAATPAINSIFIQDNDALTSLRGLGPVKKISGSLIIEGNDGLLNLHGLDSLKSVGGETNSLAITRNNSLETIDGLSALEITEGGSVVVFENPKLKNLDGFSSLHTIYSKTLASLYINNNASLSNIDGLSNLTSLYGTSARLELVNNTSLTRCCGLYPLFQDGGIYGPGGITVQITGNAAGCTRADIESGGPCDGAVTVEQPTNLVFTSVTQSGMHGSFTAPANAPAGYITLMNDSGSPFPGDEPTDGATYTVGQKIGNSTVVSSGTQTGFDVTGLDANRTYYFNVFSYGSGYDYLVTDPLAGSKMTSSTPSEGLTFSNVTASTMTVSFAADSSSPEGYVVLMRAFGSPAPNDMPVDGTSYNVGNVIGSSTIVVGVGSQTSHDVVYLMPGTRYYFDVFSYTSGYDYNTDNYSSGNQETRVADPPSNITFANITDNSMTVSLTAPSVAPDGYVTLMRAFGSPSPDDVPVDGTTYNVGNVIGSSTIVVGKGSDTSLDIVYLDPDTEYYFDIYSYKNTSNGPRYLIEMPLQGSQRTSNAVEAFAVEKAAPFPNPFTDFISIPFTTTAPSTFITIVIHDQMGRKVAELASDSFVKGYHEVPWDRTDLRGNRILNGLYVYSIQSTGKEESVSGVIVAR